jgi:4-amino-4-deoxy-L-arabinose transferase-like glycosyltransferase
LNQPTPAIVAQSAVRRLPRLALLLLCVAYVVPGFVGREPWRTADMTAFGYMLELSGGSADWLAPSLLGHVPEFDALLPYWLGAWAMQAAPAWLDADFAARLPFVALLVVTLLSTWYSVYYLARRPGAQPVAFAFGGEAHPTDYARAMADGGLLALIACLGLAQLTHETTPALAQLGFSALTFYALAALPYRTLGPVLALLAGAGGLSLSGAPSLAVLFAAGGAAVTLLLRDQDPDGGRWQGAAWALLAAVLAAVLASTLDLWRWRVAFGRDWGSAGRLLLWFTWPAWPLALWTLWRWRRQLASHHVALPLWFAAVSIIATLVTPSSDRSLLLGLPAFAALAAFALPTLKRSVAALIDWFTLLFFSGWALVIWVVWLSLQTGIPAKPAANVARLAPGFEPSFSLVAFLAALGGTLAWGWLVRWRAGRHRAAIWKSLVLPAGGATLCWLLLMTLWLPALDFARSYVPVVRALQQRMDRPGCVEVFGLDRGQVAALRFHGGMSVRSAGTGGECPWLVMAPDVQAAVPIAFDMRRWELVSGVRRPTDRDSQLMLYRQRDRQGAR